MASLTKESILQVTKNLEATVIECTVGAWVSVVKLLQDDDESLREKATTFVSKAIARPAIENVDVAAFITATTFGVTSAMEQVFSYITNYLFRHAPQTCFDYLLNFVKIGQKGDHHFLTMFFVL